MLDQDDKFIGDENCLFLNVYKPKNMTVNQMLPVILYIHGGAFGTKLQPSYDTLVCIFCCLQFSEMDTIGVLNSLQLAQ